MDVPPRRAGGGVADHGPVDAASVKFMRAAVRNPHMLALLQDQERRIRREIANSNERRRMQSINAGFQSLRTLLPHHEGEKLSKVSHISSSFFMGSS